MIELYIAKIKGELKTLCVLYSESLETLNCHFGTDEWQ